MAERSKSAPLSLEGEGGREGEDPGGNTVLPHSPKPLDETSGTPQDRIPHNPPTFPLIRGPELWPFDPFGKPITSGGEPNCLKFNLRRSFVPPVKRCDEG